jgi:hypothetical protein
MVHVCLMVSILLYAYLMSMVPGQAPGSLDTTLFWAPGAMSVIGLCLGQFIRSQKLRPAFERLQTKPDDPPSLAQWRIGVIVSDCLAETVALCGFAIHMLGATNRHVTPFFVVAFAAMILWWPRRP